jgi:hypothetical protein
MPMQRLLVRPHPLPDPDVAGDVHACAAAAIDFLGETNGGSSSDSNVTLPSGEGVLEGKVWKLRGQDIMVAAAVQRGGWAAATPQANMNVVQLRDLEVLSLNSQRAALT